ncbi:unnamed protein product [Lactuca saligna]|uniref:Uncharacterized protein n=1 Tax=Lactuca saligna TaxID=75948 RepID=A0AA36DX78_LACSI|nr:unnamed protein product [Lactuca saligna]
MAGCHGDPLAFSNQPFTHTSLQRPLKHAQKRHWLRFEHTHKTRTAVPHIRWLTVTRKGVSSERDSHRVEMATFMREKGRRTRERRKGLPMLENVEERRPPTSALTHASDGSETTMIVLCLLGGSTDRKNSVTGGARWQGSRRRLIWMEEEKELAADESIQWVVAVASYSLRVRVTRLLILKRERMSTGS